MSMLVYNSVTLPYPMTTSFNQVATYDESNTDRMLTKFDISVQSILHADYIPIVCPDLARFVAANTPAATIMGVIRSRLLQSRKTLSFSFNGVELIPGKAGEATGLLDAKNGPLPQNCSITQLNDSTFLINFHIIAHYIENNKIHRPDPDDGDSSITNQATNGVILNRWEEAVSIDSCGMTTKSRNGKIVIRSDQQLGNIVDIYRSQFAVVGVPLGFLRDSSNYTVSADGLMLSYRVVDKETFKQPPPLAFEAKGHYSESTSKAGGKRYGEAYIQLKGAKTTPQHKLIETAIIIVSQKLKSRVFPMAGPDGLGPITYKSIWSILESASLKIGLYENTVEFSMRVMGTSPVSGYNYIAAFGGIGTFTYLSDDVINYVPPYKDRGSANILLNAAAYYDPSLAATMTGATLTTAPVDTAVNDKNNLSTGKFIGTAGSSPE